MKRWISFSAVVAMSFLSGAARGETRGCTGDIDGDGVIGLSDLAILLAAYDTCVGDPFFNPDADLDDSGCVDLGDLALLLSVYGTTCPDQATRVELAGNALDEYPFFEYVRAFNEDATVDVAIDPIRFPEIVGQTCNLYIVAAKTESEWAADPSLVDVTPGGAQTQTLSGATIQDNTFVVAEPYELDADAALGLGVGYDVVLDMNRDGLLDEGDYIDGLGDDAGLYTVHDVVQDGPLTVTEVLYTGGAWLGQDTYYPSSIAQMDELPLIVISHGNGHNYQWYDHLGYHLASYGYIVMSHENNTGPGSFTASTTTLTNTDYIIGHQDTIAGGVLDGHIDSHRITWIGHSRGGEGVVIAYDRLFDGTYTPDNFVLDDVVLISSMLPVDFEGPTQTNPHSVNYHLWTAMGDSDVRRGTYKLYERAIGMRQSTSVQGAGHGDFHAGSGSAWFTGPCHIEPQSRVHDILKGYFLPLIKYYVNGNVPAKDFLWRQWEHFKPIGAPEGPICDVTGGDTVVVTNEFKQTEEAGKFVIEDYQSEPDTGTSSSGGAVIFTVTNVHEDLLRDRDGTYYWTPSDPMNGFDRARESGDWARGCVFDWAPGTTAYYECEVVPAGQDFSRFVYLSFRACQQTQHPYTTAVIEDLTFTATLRDADGTSSSINLGVYGGGIEEPYQRDGGWHNEMETIRIRLTDFLHNGSGLDLTDIAAVRFEFGAPYGSEQGRIGIDDIEVTSDPTPDSTGGPPGVFIAIGLPDGAPPYLAPGVETPILVRIIGVGEDYVPDSATLHYSYDGGAFHTAPDGAVEQYALRGNAPRAGL